MKRGVSDIIALYVIHKEDDAIFIIEKRRE